MIKQILGYDPHADQFATDKYGELVNLDGITLWYNVPTPQSVGSIVIYQPCLFCHETGVAPVRNLTELGHALVATVNTADHPYKIHHDYTVAHQTEAPRT